MATGKTIYSLTLNGGTFTRESGRPYTAALVSTITEESLRMEAARVASAEIEATRLEASYAALLVARGTTLEAAQAEYDVLYGAAKATLDNSKGFDNWDAYKTASGHAHDARGPHGVVEAARKAQGVRRTAVPRALVLGNQVVVSWHHSVALAQKAAAHLASVDALPPACFRAYSVRTDLTTRVRATRAKKTEVAS